MNTSAFASFEPHFIWLATWMSHSWVNWILGLVSLLIVINPLPLQARSIDTTSRDFLLIWIRRISFFLLIFFVLIVPPYLYFLYGIVYDATLKEIQDDFKWIVSFLATIAKADGFRFFLGIVLAVIFKFTYQRYVAPPLSHFLYSVRVKMVSDKLSDVRNEIGKLKRKNYNPMQYYQPNHIFFGLGEHNEPLYTDMDTFRKTNTQIIGPTRFGKGVLLGCLIDQAIRLGKHAAIYVDPKDDEFVPWIMWHAAGADKRFTMIDLGVEGKGTWAPFMGGNARERRTRIITACGLHDTGTDADFYKRQERGILDRIMEKSNGSIPSLLNGLEAADNDGTPLREKAPSLYEGLKELARVPALNTTGGLQVEQVLKNGWVLYFRGNINDRLLLLATRIFIMEVIQLSMRMKEERNGHHLTFAVDELKFLVSKQLSDALATSLGANVNMIVMHQTLEDLRATEDRTLDALAVQKSVEINCQLKTIYRCDPVTAEYASKASGTKLVKSQRQKMRINEFGGEEFQKEHMVMEVPEGLIPENTLLSLPPMVGVFYSPHELAKILFTAPVITEKGDDLFKLNPLFKTPARPAKEPKPEIATELEKKASPTPMPDKQKATPAPTVEKKNMPAPDSKAALGSGSNVEPAPTPPKSTAPQQKRDTPSFISDKQRQPMAKFNKDTKSEIKNKPEIKNSTTPSPEKTTIPPPAPEIKNNVTVSESAIESKTSFESKPETIAAPNIEQTNQSQPKVESDKTSEPNDEIFPV